jgi:hypothetical protein
MLRPPRVPFDPNEIGPGGLPGGNGGCGRIKTASKYFSPILNESGDNGYQKTHGPPIRAPRVPFAAGIMSERAEHGRWGARSTPDQLTDLTFGEKSSWESNPRRLASIDYPGVGSQI